MSENALTPGSAVWNYIKNSVPSQLGAAGHLAQSVAQPFTNLFGNGGQEFWGGPQDPQAAGDMRNALMTMYGGSAMNPAEEGALNAGLKVYRGSPAHETWPMPKDKVLGDFHEPVFWSSTDPDVSNTYAKTDAAQKWGHEITPNIMPAEVDFKNPLVVDARGMDWSRIPIGHKANLDATNHLPTDRETITSDFLAHLAREAGHDGLVIKNVKDAVGSGPENLANYDSATTVAALKPGTVKSPLTGETLFSGSDKGPNPLVAALMAESQPQNAMTGIKAYHGSPYDFDKFDASKIGTGEGAQAYGHGLYFAEREGVARDYRDKLAGQWQPNFMPSMGNDPEHALTIAKSMRDAMAEAHAKTGGGAATLRQLDRAISDLEAGKTPQGGGKMYQVNINADPASFLDWDKPLAEQHPAVRQLVDKTFPNLPEAKRAALPGISGSDVYVGIGAELGKAAPPAGKPATWNDLMGSLNRPDLATASLREAGIPGIRYLDQGSRGAGKGSHNYVVFPGNEHLIEIVKKYGIAATAAMMGMKASDLAQSMGHPDNAMANQ